MSQAEMGRGKVVILNKTSCSRIGSNNGTKNENQAVATNQTSYGNPRMKFPSSLSPLSVGMAVSVCVCECVAYCTNTILINKNTLFNDKGILGKHSFVSQSISNLWNFSLLILSLKFESTTKQWTDIIKQHSTKYRKSQHGKLFTLHSCVWLLLKVLHFLSFTRCQDVNLSRSLWFECKINMKHRKI